MYIRRNPVFASVAIIVAIILSLVLISSPYMAYAEGEASTTATTETAPLMQTEDQATNVELTGETFQEQTL